MTTFDLRTLRVRSGDQAREQDVVHHERHRAVGFHHQEGLGVVLGRDDVDAQVAGGVGFGELLDVGGARVASLPALDVGVVSIELKADFGSEAELPDIGVNAARGAPGPGPRDRDGAVPVLNAQELVYPPL